MTLLSRLFRGERALESCSMRDSAHIQIGVTGDHVRKMQMALELAEASNIEKGKLAANKYGKTTSPLREVYNRSSSPGDGHRVFIFN